MTITKTTTKILGVYIVNASVDFGDFVWCKWGVSGFKDGRKIDYFVKILSQFFTLMLACPY
ncbi:hypothetical protein B9Q02_11900 [Candidatus Marsarchaeota G1 archaeon BE_D]|jgi:hypothetical protein|uniref:Uncharacterized protein n=1 Tax=Candidatus Marsarchaeota G1 archaeon BE_D TaxID=1978156 RepID=A0A2R6A7M0_9ARCH|nr:MAG: hypothetical protein B9Q02_11900 [Candidatus Marsarchaeota G1 archaeon BE_D]